MTCKLEASHYFKLNQRKYYSNMPIAHPINSMAAPGIVIEVFFGCNYVVISPAYSIRRGPWGNPGLPRPDPGPGLGLKTRVSGTRVGFCSLYSQSYPSNSLTDVVIVCKARPLYLHILALFFCTTQLTVSKT